VKLCPDKDGVIRKQARLHDPTLPSLKVWREKGTIGPRSFFNYTS